MHGRSGCREDDISFSLSITTFGVYTLLSFLLFLKDARDMHLVWAMNLYNLYYILKPIDASMEGHAHSIG